MVPVQAGECRVDLAEETAAEMSDLLDELRETMPEAQLVLMAPLPKGEYWPNRCTPAFRVFSETLQVLFHPQQCELGASGIAKEPHHIGSSLVRSLRNHILTSKLYAQDFAAEEPDYVHFLDLSASFLVRPSSEIWANATANTRQEINEMFMPDAQHPSAAGMRIIAAELEPLVRRLVSAAQVDMDTV